MGTFNLTTGDYITAVFEPVLFTDSLVINEIMYNADTLFDTKDWVEFYNPHDYALDITGWQFRDEDDAHIFEFPASTVIEPNGFLVLVRDSAAFASFYPDVDNFLGEMDFGLNSAGELIRIFNADGILVDTVNYDNKDPWPTEPDGDGPTLELKYWEYDNALPESWVALEGHGTPGAMNGYTVGKQEYYAASNLNFAVYPNPATDVVYIQLTSAQEMARSRLIIQNNLGKVVYSQDNISDERVDLDISGFAPGIYFCSLQVPEKGLSQTKKLMVR